MENSNLRCCLKKDLSKTLNLVTFYAVLSILMFINNVKNSAYIAYKCSAMP
jgi:hypothetical protein